MSLELLKLFSWGTYQEYKGTLLPGWSLMVANEQHLPPLNDLQIDKLRRLTLVTLASESHV